MKLRLLVGRTKDVWHRERHIVFHIGPHFSFHLAAQLYSEVKCFLVEVYEFPHFPLKIELFHDTFSPQVAPTDGEKANRQILLGKPSNKRVI